MNEMERQFRIDDRGMKYMTVLLDSQADMERIQEEMVQKVETAASPADGAEAPTNPAASTAAAASAADDEDEATESRETDCCIDAWESSAFSIITLVGSK